jgi:hypothetical protein
MNRTIQNGIVIAGLLAALIQTSEAGSWGRSVTIQNAQGTTHRRISGTYGEGTASRNATTTTPDGRTFTNSTTATRTANGWTVNRFEDLCRETLQRIEANLPEEKRARFHALAEAESKRWGRF